MARKRPSKSRHNSHFRGETRSLRSEKHWFHSDEFIWGWYPTSWQGWLILLIYIAVFLYGSWSFLPRAGVSTIDASHRFLAWLAIAGISGAILMIIVWRTGGKPHGRQH